jgi:hypothetical protein
MCCPKMAREHLPRSQSLMWAVGFIMANLGYPAKINV